MNETRPRRVSRETALNEAAPAQAVAEAAASVIEEHKAAEPEPGPTTPAAQAVSATPVYPAAPDSVPSDKSPEAEATDAWSALTKAQSALARGFEEAAVEMTGMSRSGMAATADAAVALLGARTFAEAIEINAGLARRGVDAMLEGATRISEIGARAMTDASRPLLSRFGRSWSALGGP